MKFLFFIASTMLIVLISQHSTIALPLNETVINGSCSEGFEMSEGRCMPIKINVTERPMESTSPSQDTIIREEKPTPILKIDPIPRFGACPTGTVRGINGMCEKKEINESIQVTTESTKDAPIKLSEQNVLERCPEGTRRSEKGVCEKIIIDDKTPMTTEARIETTTTTIIEKPILKDCPEGTRRNEKGICEDLKIEDKIPTTTESRVEITTLSTERDSSKDCREGTRRGANGICEEIKFNDQPVPLDRPKTDEVLLKTDDKDARKRCPEGTRLRVDGICEEIKLNDQPVPLDRLKTDDKDARKRCPEGTRRGANGICEEIKLNDQPVPLDRPKTDEVLLKTDDKDARKRCPEGKRLRVDGICEKLEVEDDKHIIEEVTEEIKTKTDEEHIPKRCPEGTKLDEEGACVAIKVEIPTKVITDLKVLLDKDGSCPEDYKKIDGRCLYIKPKIDSKTNPLYLTADDHIANDFSMTKIDDEKGHYELVPVLEDNSCPPGTQYSSYGLCRRFISKSIPTTISSIDGRCPENYEFIQGKCSPKKSHVEDLMELTTKVEKIEKPLPDTERTDRE